jgi:hypothetical protein
VVATVRLEFDWSRSATGYRWLQATLAKDPAQPSQPPEPPQPALVAAEPEPSGGQGISALPPTADAALFLNIARLSPSQDAILAFANRHGDLGPGSKLLPARGPRGGGNTPLRGTLLVTWRYLIADMQRLTGLWGLLREGDRDRLAQHVVWHKDKKLGVSVHFNSHPTGAKTEGPALGFHRVNEVIASEASHADMLKTFEVGDPVLPGWAYLQSVINEGLHYTADRVAAQMDWDPKRGRPVLGFAAPTLLAAAWLQLADAVSNDLTFSQCRECGVWLAVGPDAARPHRRFCSDRCRVKHFRERQERARQLFTNKKTFEEIALELDSDVPTVRKWITGFKE